VYAIRVDPAELRTLMARYNLTPLASPIARNVYRVTSKVSALPQALP
jgi:hypothetical protein